MQELDEKCENRKKIPTKRLALAGILLAALYAVLREFLDVRIKGAEDLSGKYDIPVLGSVPEFEISSKKKKAGGNK